MLLLPVAVWSREPELPKRNLIVELRWVDAVLSGAALSGVRQGAVVVGTAGSVSPGPAVTTSTLRRDAAAIQQVRVLNGMSASVMMSEPQAVQWVETAVELPLDGAGRGGARVLMQPRSSPAEPRQGFVVSPRWPGGEAPVRVELRSLAPIDGGRAEVLSTVQLALDEWLTVARSGGTPSRAAQGVTSSSDAQAQRTRELQIRVQLAP